MRRGYRPEPRTFDREGWGEGVRQRDLRWSWSIGKGAGRATASGRPVAHGSASVGPARFIDADLHAP